MWILLSVLSAVTAGISIVFQKKGTAVDAPYRLSVINSIAMLVVMALICFIGGGVHEVGQITVRCWLLTLLSGIIQAASWLTYFFALRDANVSFLMVLDKANILVTMLLAWLFVGEEITGLMLAGSGLIIAGSLVMGEFNGGIKSLLSRNNRWIFWGLVSPSLQGTANILVKLDNAPVSSSLTATVRTLVVTVLLYIAARKKEGALRELKGLSGRELFFLVSGGGILGVSYILMYEAIAAGIAAVVVPIVRTGFLVSTLLAVCWLGERLTRRGRLGFAVVCAGVALFLL